MHRLTKLATILGFGLVIELASIAQAQVTHSVAPMPGPYQIIIAPQRPVQMQPRQQTTIRQNWSLPQNNAQALPYWMQNRSTPTAHPQRSTQQPTAQVSTQTNATIGTTASTNQNQHRWASQAAAAASNMMTSPGYFPGYIAPPAMANRGINPAFGNQPQYGRQNFQNGPQFNQGNLRNTGPNYRQMPRPQWGGYTPIYGPNRPTNGYGPPPGYGGYSPAPNR